MPYERVEKSFPQYTPPGIHYLTFMSPALGGRGNVSLYIPPGCEEARDLPFAVLLHGVYGTHWSYLYNAGAHVVVQRLIDAGEIRPMALVVPSDGFFGEGSGYIRNPKFDCERWIVDDVIGCAIENYPCLVHASKKFIAGYSMGGFGALRLGAKYSTRFAAAAGHSSITHIRDMWRFIKDPPEVYGDLDEGDQSVLYWMRRNRATLPAVRFDCGVEDILIEGNRALHAALEAERIPHEYHEFPGGHSWDYWREHLADTLRFFDRQLG